MVEDQCSQGTQRAVVAKVDADLVTLGFVGSYNGVAAFYSTGRLAARNKPPGATPFSSGPSAPAVRSRATGARAFLVWQSITKASLVRPSRPA